MGLLSGVENIFHGVGHIVPKPIRPLLPIVGSIAGAYYGGPWGAAAGAALGSELSGERFLKSARNAAIAGGATYGLQALSGAGGGAEAWSEGGVGESAGESLGGGEENVIPNWNDEFAQNLGGYDIPAGTTAGGLPAAEGAYQGAAMGPYSPGAPIESAGGTGQYDTLAPSGTSGGLPTRGTSAMGPYDTLAPGGYGGGGSGLGLQAPPSAMTQYPGFTNYPGLGNPGWATTALGLLSAGYNFYQGSQYADAAKEAAANMDPFRGYRKYYGKQLGNLMNDPSTIENDPTYKLGLQATQRQLAARGYRQSSNEANALADYTTHFAQEKQNQLYQYAGGGATPGAGGALQMAGQQGQMNANNNALANLGWLSYRYGY